MVAEATGKSLDFAPSVIANSEMFVNVSDGLDIVCAVKNKNTSDYINNLLIEEFKKLDVKKFGAIIDDIKYLISQFPKSYIINYMINFFHSCDYNIKFLIAMFNIIETYVK